MLLRNKPFDGESSNSWLLSKHISPNMLHDRLGGRFSVEFIGVVFVVDIVSDADKLPPIVAACEENDRNT